MAVYLWHNDYGHSRANGVMARSESPESDHDEGRRCASRLLSQVPTPKFLRFTNGRSVVLIHPFQMFILNKPVWILHSPYLHLLISQLHVIPNAFIAAVIGSEKNTGSTRSTMSPDTSRKFRLFSSGIKARRAPLSMPT